MSLVLLLAHLFVNEAGFHNVRDHGAILHALTNRAEHLGVTLEDHIHAYTAGRLINPDTPRAVWVTSLMENGGEPDRALGAGGPPWSAELSDAWKRVLNRARSWLVFPPPNPCSGKPQHWGSSRIRADAERAHRAVSDGRWSVVLCGRTLNIFFAVNRNVAQWRREASGD